VSAPQRIANLLGIGHVGDGNHVPASAVGAGFTSEEFEARVPTLFLNEMDRALTGLGYTEAALRAEAEGFAAILINTVGDYGLRAMRAALRIPVVGAGQAAMQVASGLGDRFAIVTVWPEASRTMYDQLLTEYGLTSRCSEILHVTHDAELPDLDGADGFVAQMRSGREAHVQRVARACQETIDRGADTIVLGCTCMSPIHGELVARLDRPVIDPLATGHKVAEMLLSLGYVSAPAPTPPLGAGLLGELLAGTVTPGATDIVEDACGDVCSTFGAPAAAESDSLVGTRA
jgi:allantoin racemase